MSKRTELIFGYGSLMSFRGLFNDKSKIEIFDAFKAQLKSNRGFAKPCRKKQIYCMDIDNFDLEGSIIKISPEQGNIEGLVFKINQKDFPEFCKREGYGKLNGEHLCCFSKNENSISEALWNLFQNNIIFDDNKKVDFVESIRTYRNILSDKVEGTSSNYIPHPILIKNCGYAIIFIAAGKYGTGNSEIGSEKDKKGIYKLLNACEVLGRSDVNRQEFLNYLLECLYGGVHGISVCDIIKPILKESKLKNEIKLNISRESLIEERNKFCEKIFNNNFTLYNLTFGDLIQNLTRSGLKWILDDDVMSNI